MRLVLGGLTVVLRGVLRGVDVLLRWHRRLAERWGLPVRWD